MKWESAFHHNSWHGKGLLLGTGSAECCQPSSCAKMHGNSTWVGISYRSYEMEPPIDTPPYHFKQNTFANCKTFPSVRKKRFLLKGRQAVSVRYGSWPQNNEISIFEHCQPTGWTLFSWSFIAVLRFTAIFCFSQNKERARQPPLGITTWSWGDYRAI